MLKMKLGTLADDIVCWQGVHEMGVLKKGWTVLFRGHAPNSGHHFAICQTEFRSQYVYFCHEADMTNALYSKTDAVIDLMLQSGVSITDIRKHEKADQL